MEPPQKWVLQQRRMSIQEHNLMREGRAHAEERCHQWSFSQVVCKQFVLSKQEGWEQQTGDKSEELEYFFTLTIFQNGGTWFS